jgi:hypothetical protein
VNQAFVIAAPASLMLMLLMLCMHMTYALTSPARPPEARMQTHVYCMCVLCQPSAQKHLQQTETYICA